MRKPWEDVTDPHYFRDVMDNMTKAGLGPKETVHVRFGTEGIGVPPNYQVEAQDGRVPLSSNLS